jgi:uncharacterized protein (DUF2164 family)
MEIYTPTAEELQKFRDLAQPAGLKFISAEIGSEWVDKALKGAQKAEEKVDDRAEEIVQEHIDMANEKYAAIKK